MKIYFKKQTSGGSGGYIWDEEIKGGNFDMDYWNFKWPTVTIPPTMLPYTDGTSILELNNSTHFKTNILDKKDEYELLMEVPGINKESIHVNYENNKLTVCIIKNENKDDNKYIVKEIYEGTKYTRIFNIPKVDIDNIKATIDNGVLKINLPKLEKAKSVNIKIK